MYKFLSLPTLSQSNPFSIIELPIDSVSFDPLGDFLVTQCGHAFNQETLSSLLTRNMPCPCCRGKIEPCIDVPALKTLVQNIAENQGLATPQHTAIIGKEERDDERTGKELAAYSQFAQKGEFSKMIEAGQNLVLLQPHNPRKRLLLANAYLSAEQYEKAVDTLTKVLRFSNINPLDRAGIWASIAECQLAQDNKDDAKAAVHNSKSLATRNPTGSYFSAKRLFEPDSTPDCSDVEAFLASLTKC